MTLVTAHSDKEDARGNSTGGFGHHPLGAWLDNSNEALAMLLRPGNAGSNTAADHLTVLDRALTQIPDRWRSKKVLIRADGAGYSHALISALSGQGLEFSVGYPVTEAVRDAIRLVPKWAWQAANNSDGALREHADVIEVTGLLDLSAIRTRRPWARTASLAVFHATPEALGDPSDREVLTDDPFQRPAPSAAGELGPRLGRFADVLAPDVPATRAPVAAEGDQQRGGAPAERFVRQTAGHAVARDALAAAPPAPPIRVGDPTGQHPTISLEVLADDLQGEVVQPAERGQACAAEGSVQQRRGPPGGSVRTPIVKGPRPSTGQRRAHSPYTLICDEPEKGPPAGAGAGRTEQ